MSIVVDASVAVKWVLNEPCTEAALALRNEELIAPALWLAEAANARCGGMSGWVNSVASKLRHGFPNWKKRP